MCLLINASAFFAGAGLDDGIAWISEHLKVS